MSSAAISYANRRRFRRVKAPVFCRPLGKPLFSRGKEAIDISEGGLRIYADDESAPGDRFKLELFLPDESTVTCRVEVVWIDALPEGSPARFDMGLKFLDPDDPELAKLSAVLELSPTSSA